MSIESQITEKLESALSPAFLQVENESYKHNVPKGSESHFKVVIVSDSFESMTRIERHQKVHAVLADELQQSIHALALQLHTPAQWEAKGEVIAKTPPCLGGDK